MQATAEQQDEQVLTSALSVPAGPAASDPPPLAAGPALPVSPPPATPGKRWLALCFAASFLVYVALIPHFLRFSNPPSGDQPLYLMDTISLVQDGDLNVANNYAQHDEDKFYKLAPHPEPFVGVNAPDPLPPQLAQTPNRPATEQYSWHAPGLGTLLVPAWIVGSWFGLWWPTTIVFMCMIGALVGLNVFLLAYELTGRRAIAWAVWLPMAFSAPIMSYSLLIFSELPAGLLLIYAVRRLARGWGANRPWQLALTGLAIGYLPWLAWRYLPITVGLGAMAAVQWGLYWRTARRQGSPPPAAPAPSPGYYIGAALWLLLPLAILLLLMAAYDLFLFGTIGPNPIPGVGAEPAIFYWPWGDSQARLNFVNGAFAIFFDQQWGLLPHTPLYLLAAVGMIALWRRGSSPERRLLGWMGLVALPYVAMIAAFNYWGGLWCPPARYLTPVVPLLAGPMAVALVALGRSWLYRLLYLLLALPGFAYMTLTMANPLLMFPMNQGYFWDWLATSPDSPFHLNLRRVLPTFAWPDLVRQPFTTGSIIGVAVLIVFGCDLLLRLHYGAMWRRARRVPTHALAWVGAIAIVGGGWFTINAEYLKHKTMLVQQNRWTIQTALAQPLGIAYLDGRVFLADYQGGLVGALDTRTGAFQAVAPQSAQGQVKFTHPGDIKLGPDGLIYVLNNGPGDQALLGLRPNGQVMRRLALNEKSDVAVGLSFGPDGLIYVGDMIGGYVHQYAMSGGPPIRNLSDPSDNFNNLAGVTVAPDGAIYAADVGLKRVVRMAPDGRIVQHYDLGCAVWFTVADGDWLEASCDKGLWSINTRTGAIETVRADGDNQPPASPTGLAFGSDGLLYVLDGNTIAAYRVEH